MQPFLLAGKYEISKYAADRIKHLKLMQNHCKRAIYVVQKQS